MAYKLLVWDDTNHDVAATSKITPAYFNFNADLLPDSDVTRSIGSASARLKALFTKDLHVSGYVYGNLEPDSDNAGVIGYYNSSDGTTKGWNSIYAHAYYLVQLDGNGVPYRTSFDNYFAHTTLDNVLDSVILSKIKNVDGSGSGLDADTVDGKHATDFALASHTHNVSDITFDGSVVPNANDTYYLGSSDNKWHDVISNLGHFDSLTAGALNVTGATTIGGSLIISSLSLVTL